VAGGTTAEINRAGNIREDMFRLLVVADLVIADVSIHNANVFYELGIRHALRPRHTFMIRSATTHKYPFDLQTDRYLLYDSGNPAGDDGTMVTSSPRRCVRRSRRIRRAARSSSCCPR
jgi:hypothetical protein